MLEFGVFCVVLVAAFYWTTLFVMGRRDDVIHGKFVHSEDEPTFVPQSMPVPPPRLPERPAGSVQPGNDRPVNAATARPVDSAALQSLLAAIQQDLKSVA